MREGPLFVLLLAVLIAFCCDRESRAREPDGSCFASTIVATKQEPTLQDRIFAVLQSMPPSVWDEDEPPNDREARLDFAAHLIATASRDYRDAAALLTLWWFESRGALYVWRGCRPEEIPEGAPDCSGGNARSPWQLEEVACHEGWELPRGSDEALYEFARCARARWRGALTACGSVHGAFARYATGSECEHPQAAARARDYQLRLLQLQR